MSVSFYCHCPERLKPILERRWRVAMREHNRSAFNGYRYSPSDYSDVLCLACGAWGRTKAKYVALLEDATDEEKFNPRIGEPLPDPAKED